MSKKPTKPVKPSVAARRAIARLQIGLATKKFTLKAAAKEAGIPITTLADMTKPEWGDRATRTMDRLEQLDAAISRLEGAQ